jgi:iron-sulfur cluster insertion protein
MRRSQRSLRPDFESEVKLIVTTQGATITLTQRAARRIAFVLKKETNENLRLRVAVSGGGCSGFQYGFTLDDVLADDDQVIEHDGAVVVIDEISLGYIAGAELDWVEALEGSRFTLGNPNATASCSCGSSFAI